jgi:hypothetical protein
VAALSMQTCVDSRSGDSLKRLVLVSRGAVRVFGGPEVGVEVPVVPAVDALRGGRFWLILGNLANA